VNRIAAAAALAAAILAAAAPARAAAPLTLDEALEIAARRSTDLAAARADANSASADETASVAGVLPRLDLSASFGHDFAGASDQARFVLQGGVPIPVPSTPAADQASFAAGLRLSQPLFDWGTFRDVSRARFSQRAAERSYDETALLVSFAVTQRFYEVVRADRTLDVFQKTAARSEEFVRRTEALYAAGRVAKSDVLQAQSNLANDRVAVEAQRIRVSQSRNALAAALAYDSGEELSVVPPASLEGAAAASPEPPSIGELLALARERRPALAAQDALVSAADAAVSSANGRWFPTVSAQGAYNRQGADLTSSSGVYGDPTRNYSATVALVLSWNIFEGRFTTATVRRAEAQLSRARASQGATAARVVQEVADARASASSLVRQVALAQEALAVAQQGLALARERLDAGLATQLEVRDASLKLTQAELSLVGSRIDGAVARADLARAVGGPF
jgi:outer membrane protein